MIFFELEDLTPVGRGEPGEGRAERTLVLTAGREICAKLGLTAMEVHQAPVDCGERGDVARGREGIDGEGVDGGAQGHQQAFGRGQELAGWLAACAVRGPARGDRGGVRAGGQLGHLDEHATREQVDGGVTQRGEVGEVLTVLVLCRGWSGACEPTARLCRADWPAARGRGQGHCRGPRSNR